jgi:hypothetical protein
VIPTAKRTLLEKLDPQPILGKAGSGKGRANFATTRSTAETLYNDTNSFLSEVLMLVAKFFNIDTRGMKRKYKKRKQRLGRLFG